MDHSPKECQCAEWTRPSKVTRKLPYRHTQLLQLFLFPCIDTVADSYSQGDTYVMWGPESLASEVEQIMVLVYI
jgi:hypothetical protein